MTAPTPDVALLDRPWLTRIDAAAIARVSPTVIGVAVRSGALREFKGAGERSGRIKRADLDAWIESASTRSGARR